MHEVREGSGRVVRSEHAAGYAGWLAVGAVVAGSIGAIVGAARCSHRADGPGRQDDMARLDPASLTAPHGDKLSRAL